MGQDEVLARIEQAAAEGWTELDLSAKGLTKIPESIAQLSNLTTLILFDNQISSIPESIAQLSNLTTLYLGSNQISSIPESIAQLSNLTTLYLWSNQISSIPESIAQLSNLTKLDLGENQISSIPEPIVQLSNLITLSLVENQISSIPESIAQLSNLTELYLRGNQISSIPEVIAQLSNLTTLDLSRNELSSIPESIAQLSNLTELYLRGNQISSIPEVIAQLSNLTTLDLSRNELSSIPESIAQLSNLTELYLDDNTISSIPEVIAQLSNLTTLSLVENQISSIPELIAQLSNLTILDLGFNQISSIPEWIAQLSNLTTLNLGFNQISSIPEWIAQLSNLTTLSLSGNKISSIPEWIAQLSNLTTLSLSRNQISSISESIAQLSNLTTLSLSRNQISSISESIAQLSNLTTLDLSDNQISSLPQGMENLTKLKELDLQGNLLEIPPEILAPQPKEMFPDAGRILDYYFSEKTYIYEAKILIVGEGGAGKTSLANKLIDPAYQLRPEAVDISTEGIDILRWEFVGRDQKTYKVNIWDFGGQDIYHQTHQFFLTERAVYLLVADSRKEDTDHYWWLQVIRLLGKDSPVVLVQNEKQDRSCNLNFRELRAEFTLQTPEAINLATNRHLAELRTCIQRNLEDLLAKGTPFPKTWLAVREALESDPRNYIDYGDYVSLCHKSNITRPEEISNLSQFLHDLGSCLHFQQDPILRQRLFLKPNWATTALYKILTNPAVKENLGQFSDRDLKDIWKAPEYANLHHELLQLLKEFKICYEIPQHPGNYISPHLLSAEPRNYSWDDSNNLILRYSYRGFMPKGILTRFIVEMHRLIEQVTAPSQALVWKQGVVLNYEGRTRAEIIENSYDREIRLRFSGSNQRDFLVILDHEFQQIHKTYKRLEYATLIPCNCTQCKPSPQPHTYELKKLREFIEAHRPTIQCYKSGEDVNVRRLLDDSVGEENLELSRISPKAAPLSIIPKPPRSPLERFLNGLKEAGTAFVDQNVWAKTVVAFIRGISD